MSIPKKGMGKKLRKAITTAEQAIDRLTKNAQLFHQELDKNAEWPDLHERLLEQCLRGEATLSEAKIMHNIMRDKRTAVAQRQSKVEDELMRTQPAPEGRPQVPPLNIHPSIKVRGYEFIRT